MTSTRPHPRAASNSMPEQVMQAEYPLYGVFHRRTSSTDRAAHSAGSLHFLLLVQLQSYAHKTFNLPSTHSITWARLSPHPQ